MRKRICIIPIIAVFLLSGCAHKSEQEYQQLKTGEAFYEYESYELSTESNGKQIYGVIYVPMIRDKELPAIIYSHGFGGSYRYGIDYAEEMAKRGYVVYCFDFRGGSPGSRSEGSPLEMTLFTEKDDLLSVVSMVKALEFVDSNNIFLLGTSQGGAVSAMAAAEIEDEIRGLVLLYPAFVMVDNVKALFNDADDIPSSYFFMWMSVGKEYFSSLLDYDIYGAISDYRKPVLILHGDEDSIVPLSYSEKAVEVYQSAKLKVIENAGHGFYGGDFELAVKYIADYCNSNVEIKG